MSDFVATYPAFFQRNEHHASNIVEVDGKVWVCLCTASTSCRRSITTSTGGRAYAGHRVRIRGRSCSDLEVVSPGPRKPPYGLKKDPRSRRPAHRRKSQRRNAQPIARPLAGFSPSLPPNGRLINLPSDDPGFVAAGVELLETASAQLLRFLAEVPTSAVEFGVNSADRHQDPTGLP